MPFRKDFQVGGYSSLGLWQAEGRVSAAARGWALQDQAWWEGLTWLFSRGFSDLCFGLPWVPSPPASPLLRAQSPSDPEALQPPIPYSWP